MQRRLYVGRKLTLLATMMVLPGGLVALVTLACLLLLARSERGRRALAAVLNRVPARLRAPLGRFLPPPREEHFFPREPPAVHPT